jgi:hypothetical protein
LSIVANTFLFWWAVVSWIGRGFEFAYEFLAGEKRIRRDATIFAGYRGSDSVKTEVIEFAGEFAGHAIFFVDELPVRMEPKHFARSAILGLGVANWLWKGLVGSVFSLYSFKPVTPISLVAMPG